MCFELVHCPMKTRSYTTEYQWLRKTCSQFAFPILTWCPAESYRKRRSAPPYRPRGSGKDFTLLLYTYKCTKFG